ncbi:MAG TPA: ABC transporter substrate-binding protein [Dehalococcoidia bacterium]|nr:ABC transporter substrate-binding protein [Dehalococcoidia bacterium]
MVTSYWSAVLSKIINRRRMLAGSSAALAGSALLAACGGGDSDDGPKASGLMTEPLDTVKQAKRGGIRQDSVPGDIQHFDDFLISAPVPYHFDKVHSFIIGRKTAYMTPYKQELDGGELAESWELSPDKLTLTLKIRADANLDPRPPTNGRAMDANDIEFTWQRWEARASNRSNLSNKFSPAAPITSVTAVDPRTVVIKMAFPQAAILFNLTGRGAGISVFPREADGQYDPRQVMRGSGPFMQTEYVPSVSFKYERNPGWYGKDRPLIDGVFSTIIPEYAAALAQFRAGKIYSYAVRPEDILVTKKDAPDLNLYKQWLLNTPSGRLFYGFEGGMAKSPFIDERVRQAYSLSLDRDLWIDTFFNVPVFEAEGLPMEKRWNTAIPARWDGFWLNPQDSKAFGESAKYYQHSVAEAKKLLAAAGYNNGVELASHHIVTADYGRDFPKHIETMFGMALEAGIKIRTEATDFNTSWRPLADSKGKFDGIAFINLTPPEPTNWVKVVYHKTGANYKGFSADTTAANGDPAYDDLTDKIDKEFDQAKSFSLLHELQRLEAKRQYSTPFPGGASSFELTWPVLANWNVWNGARRSAMDEYIWLDGTKKPLAKA